MSLVAHARTHPERWSSCSEDVLADAPLTVLYNLHESQVSSAASAFLHSTPFLEEKKMKLTGFLSVLLSRKPSCPLVLFFPVAKLWDPVGSA